MATLNNKQIIHIFIIIVLVIVCNSLVLSAPNNNNNKKVARSRFPSNFINTEDECNCRCGVSARNSRVVGGEDTKMHEFPWIVALFNDTKFICGATLITKRHIITAAHCVEKFSKKHLTAVFGDHDRDDVDRYVTVVIRGIKKTKIHENYDSIVAYNNDIAILELEKPVDFDQKIQPVCLPDSDFSDYIGQPAVVAGWGWGKLGESSEISTVLQKVIVPVWSEENCYKSGYGEFKLTDNMFCAGYPEGKKDACKGDSGGPLNLKNTQGVTEIIGIVSFGRGCARPDFPGIYTKITNYMPWIYEAIEGECLCSTP